MDEGERYREADISPASELLTSPVLIPLDWIHTLKLEATLPDSLKLAFQMI